MRLSNYNEATLSNLLEALGSGLSPDVAGSIYNQTIGTQMDANAQHRAIMLQKAQQQKQQMSDWAQQVLQFAGSGTNEPVAQSMMDLLTPGRGLPPAVRGMLSTAYGGSPDYINQAPTYQFGVGPMNLSFSTQPEANYYNQQAYNNWQSPFYTQNPDVQAQQEQQQAALEAAQNPQPTESQLEQQQIGDLARKIKIALDSGSSAEEIYNAIATRDPQAYGVLMKNWRLFMQFFPGVVPGAGGF